MRENFSPDEIMATCTSKLFADGEVCFIGTGLPMVAAYLAKATHAPNATLMFESGIIDSEPEDLARGVGDFRLVGAALRVSDLLDVLTLLHGGHVHLGMLGCAQIDPFGNINTTAIGNYNRPTVRLPGSGGANDIASLAGRVVIVARLDKRRFVEKLDYVTTPGFLTGGAARKEAGLPGFGPVAVVTDLCVFGFREPDRHMCVRSIHPGVSAEDIRSRIGFEVEIEKGCPTTEAPTSAELRLLRERIDPHGMYVKSPNTRKAS
jgi:glutaconate CoA-transferase, subunit B